MSVLDRFIGELQAARAVVAEQSLTNPQDKTAFGFGVSVGRLEGLRLAEETLNNVLNIVREEDKESGAGRRSGKA